MSIDKFPTLDEVNKADAEQLARWYRFLHQGQHGVYPAESAFRRLGPSGM